MNLAKTKGKNLTKFGKSGRINKEGQEKTSSMMDRVRGRTRVNARSIRKKKEQMSPQRGKKTRSEKRSHSTG